MPQQMIDTLGYTHDVPDEWVAERTAQGWRPQTHQDVLQAAGEAVNERLYGGVGGGLKAGAAALARGATLGLSDVAARALGGEDTGIALEGYREAHPYVSGAGEILGAVAPGLVTAGAATPAGLASAAGRGVSRVAGGGIGGAIAGGAVEGALYGAGSGISDLALSRDPLTIEHIGSALSSNMLYGAAFGATVGGIGKAAELGLGRAKSALDGALERSGGKAANPTEAILQGDLEKIDKRILDTAERSELERIHAEQAPQRKAFTDDLDAWRRENRDAHDLRAIAKSSGDANLREAGGAFDRANFGLRAKLDDKVGFAEDPLGSLKAVRTQGQALEEMRSAAALQEQAWKADVASAPERFRARIQAGDMPGEVGPFSPSGLDLAVERAIKEHEGYAWGAKGAVRDGLKAPPIVGRMSTIDSMIESNRKLQAQLEELAKPPTSELLTKIAEARDVLAAPKAPSLGGAVAGAIMPFAGPLGAAMSTGGHVVKSLKNLGAAVMKRTGQASSAILGTAEKAAKYTAPIATKTLMGVRYAEGRRKESDEAKQTLPELFKARTDEIKSQITVTPDGQYQMRPDARAKMATRFDGIRPTAPILADRLEEHAARRIEWLATQIPRKPDILATAIGAAADWHPSDMEMRSFARKVDAAEHPVSVLDRLAHGAITSEDSAAFHAVNPEWARDITQQVMGLLPELKKQHLPIAKAIALSIFTGVPVEPSLHPRILAKLQGQFPAEPGSGGGTAAPRAAPQFGSIKTMSKGAITPAQERAR